MSIAFFDMVGALMIIPLLPFYTERMGGDAITVGLLVSCFSAAQLVDLAVVGAACRIATAAVRSSWWRSSPRRSPTRSSPTPTRSGCSFCRASCRAPAAARRRRAGLRRGFDRARGSRQGLGWISAVTNAGVAIGPAIASLSALFSHHAPGLIAAALCLLNVLWAYRSLPESMTKDATPRERRSLRGALRELLDHPGAPVSPADPDLRRRHDGVLGDDRRPGALSRLTPSASPRRPAATSTPTSACSRWSCVRSSSGR
jgi:hypothetical protein